MLAMLIALTASLAIGTATAAILWPQPSYIAARLSVYRSQLSSRPPLPTARRASRLTVVRGRLAARVFAAVPRQIQEKLGQRLRMAGNPYGLGVGEYMSLIATATAMLPLAYLGLLVLARKPIGTTETLLLALLVAAGFQLPQSWLGFRMRARQQAIARALPDALDLITICVEAGLGLDAALIRVGQKIGGPLGQELLYALGEISLGRPRREALLDIGRRCGVADLSAFLAAILQADQMGVSIGRTLRVQSEEMKTKRRQHAEAQAMKAPTKMLIPLVLCIFPAVFVVVIGPAVISVLTGFLV